MEVTVFSVASSVNSQDSPASSKSGAKWAWICCKFKFFRQTEQMGQRRILHAHLWRNSFEEIRPDIQFSHCRQLRNCVCQWRINGAAHGAYSGSRQLNALQKEIAVSLSGRLLKRLLPTAKQRFLLRATSADWTCVTVTCMSINVVMSLCSLFWNLPKRTTRQPQKPTTSDSTMTSEIYSDLEQKLLWHSAEMLPVLAMKLGLRRGE